MLYSYRKIMILTSHKTFCKNEIVQSRYYLNKLYHSFYVVPNKIICIYIYNLCYNLIFVELHSFA